MQYSFIQTLPLQPKASKLAILLHGVGSDAQDISMIIPYMQQSLPGVHFIALDGLQKYDMGAFGYQWFSLQNRNQQNMQIEAGKTAPLVIKFLELKLAELALDFEDLFLIGFSQGTMLSMQIANSFDKKLAGIIGFAGAIIPPQNFDGNNNTPICFIHGSNDEILHIDLMHQSADFMKKLGFKVETHTIPNLTHSIDMRCIQIANNFISNLI